VTHKESLVQITLLHSCYRCLSICLTVTPRHLYRYRRNRCQLPLARKQQCTACCRQLQITYQPGAPFRGPKRWESLGARLRPCGRLSRRSHSCDMQCAVTLLSETPLRVMHSLRRVDEVNAHRDIMSVPSTCCLKLLKRFKLNLALAIYSKWYRRHLYLVYISLTSPLLHMKLNQNFIDFLKNS
jgi:hypothetical protein